MRLALRLVMACLLLAAVTSFLIATPAAAHVRLERTEPAADAAAAVAPKSITLHFNSALEPAFSTLRVVDRAGRQVDARDVVVAADDRHALSVSLPALAAGTYTVFWRAICADSHPSEGSFAFSVK